MFEFISVQIRSILDVTLLSSLLLTTLLRIFEVIKIRKFRSDLGRAISFVHTFWFIAETLLYSVIWAKRFQEIVLQPHVKLSCPYSTYFCLYACSCSFCYTHLGHLALCNLMLELPIILARYRLPSTSDRRLPVHSLLLPSLPLGPFALEIGPPFSYLL